MPDGGALGLGFSDDPATWAAQRRAMFAQGLMQQASDSSPVRSPWQAVARAASGLLGGYEMGQSQQDMQTYAQGSRNATADIYAGMLMPGLPPVAGQGAAPALSPAPPPQLPIQPGSSTPAPQSSTAPVNGAASPALVGFLSHRESGGNPQALNKQGYTGEFQLGTPDLQSAGLYTPAPGENLNANQWQGTLHIPGFPEVRTQADLLGNRSAQSAAFQATAAFNDAQLAKAGAYNSVGQTVNGVPITRDGLLAGAHLGGVGGVMKFLNGQGNPQDANGTSVGSYIAGAGSYQPPGGDNASAPGTQFAGPGAPPTPGQGGQVSPPGPANSSTGAPAAPGAAAPPVPGAASPQAVAANYGMQLAQQYRAQAVQAARSPYASARAMAPQLMQQAAAVMQYGRYQPAGTTAAGQYLMLDRQTGKMEAVGAEVHLTETPNGWIDPTGKVVAPSDYGVMNATSDAMKNGTATPQQQGEYNAAFARKFSPKWETDPTDGSWKLMPAPGVPTNLYTPPGFGGAAPGAASGGGAAPGGPPSMAPYGGGGGASMPAPNVPLAKQSGVPVMPGSPYTGMTPVEAQKASQADYEKANATLAASDQEAEAAKQQITQLQRFKQLNQDVPTGSDFASRLSLWTRQHVGNDAKLQEMNSLTQSVIPGMRNGTGISRVTNKDMGVFEKMAPGTDNSPEANAQIADAGIRKAQTALEYNRFQHDYLNANRSLMGVDSAWDSYMAANPIFTPDQNGNPQLNPSRTDRVAWFKNNTNEHGQLAIGRSQGPQSGGGGAPQPPASAAPAAPSATPQMPPASLLAEGHATKFQNGQTWSLQNGVPVRVQ